MARAAWNIDWKDKPLQTVQTLVPAFLWEPRTFVCTSSIIDQGRGLASISFSIVGAVTPYVKHEVGRNDILT